MNLSTAFPSAFLKASDLQGRPCTVTIEQVTMEEIGQGRDKERKLLISFVGKTKKLVCNKTNAGTIGRLYGEETDGWIGAKITLVEREVEFQGDMVWSIRVSLQKPSAAPANPAPFKAHRPAPIPAQHEPESADESEASDDIPF